MDDYDVSWTTFVQRELVLNPGTVPLFLFFNRHDFNNPPGNNPRLGDLKQHLFRLFKVFLYITYHNKGRVILSYVEPFFTKDQETVLPLPHRCTFTSEFCFIFLLESPTDPDQDDCDQLLWGTINPGIGRSCLIKEMVTTPVLKLICADMGLVSTRRLYTITDLSEKHFDELFQMVKPDWKCYDKFKKSIVTKYEGALALTYTLKVAQPPVAAITRDRFLNSADVYFEVPGEETQNKSKLEGNEAVWFCIKRFMNLDRKGDYLAGMLAVSDHPMLNVLKEIVDVASEGGAVQLHGGIMFNYSLEALIGPTDFEMYRDVPLYGYPYLPPPASANGSEKTETVEQYRQRIILAGAPPETTFKHLNGTSGFSIAYPHLGPIRGLVKALEQHNTGEKLTPLNQLQLNIELMNKILMVNAARIPVNPIRGFYTKLKAFLSAGSWSQGLASVFKETLIVGCQGDHSSIPRIYDGRLLKRVFVDDLHLKRCVQAVLSLDYIFHNTAPKWRMEKNMIVNYTRGGTGKTYTNDAIRTLLMGVPDLFKSLSTFTDASFKYSTLEICKVVFMDDVGFNTNQKKNLKEEDNIISGQFKCILDKGFTMNRITEKSATTGKHLGTDVISVQNCGYIWNTNTTASFAAAWGDRCIILGNETSSSPITPKSDTFLRDTIVARGHDATFTKQFLRHHLFQTIINTLTNEAVVEANYQRLYEALVDHLRAKYPSCKTGGEGSKNRDLFKPLDMAVGDSLRLAINTVFDLWIPPWTEIPEWIPGDTPRTYTVKLGRARKRALGHMRPAELVLESMVHQQILLPGSFVQVVCMLFNQDTNAPIERIAAFLRHAIAAPNMMLGPAKDILEFDNPSAYDEGLDGDRSLLEVAKKITVKNKQGEFTRLVSGLKIRDGKGITSLDIDPWMATELLKLHHSQLVTEVFDPLIRITMEECTSGGFSYQPKSHVHRNVLSVYARHDPNIGQGPAGFMVSGSFQGIAVEGLRRKMIEEQDFQTIPDFMPAEYLTTEFHLGCGPEDLTAEGATARFIESKYNVSTIKQFDNEFVGDDDILSLFTNARQVLFISGDIIEPTPPSRSRPGDGWEYRMAAAMYEKYIGREMTGDAARDRLLRYISPISSPEDPLYRRLRESSPWDPMKAYAAAYRLSRDQVPKTIPRKEPLNTTPGTQTMVSLMGGTKRGRSPTENEFEEIPLKVLKECKSLLSVIRTDAGFVS